MERVRQRELHALDLDGATLVRARQVVDLCALLLEPAFQLDERDDAFRRELLRQFDRAPDVIGVAVRDRDHVDALRLLLGVRALRIVEPRVDVHPFASGRVEPERRVSQPGQRRVGHRAPFGWAVVGGRD